MNDFCVLLVLSQARGSAALC